MRRAFLLVITFFGLIATTVFVWNRLHQRSPGIHIKLDQPSPEVAHSLADQSRAIDLSLSDSLKCEQILIGFSFSAQNLTRGPEDWQDGRLHLEWLDAKGGMLERHFLASCYGNTLSAAPALIVAGPPEAKGLRIHIENLGLSGTCRLDSFHAQAVRPRPSFVLATSCLSLAWIIWASSIAGSFRNLSCLLAGIIWFTVAWQTVLPGPWPFKLPLLGEFHGVEGSSVPEKLQETDFRKAPSYPGSIENPNLLLRWKIELQALRPILHGLLFFAPSLALLYLIPWPRAAILAFSLAALVEWSQWAIGYGFDRTDLLDLATDATGITLAILAWKALERCHWMRRPLHWNMRMRQIRI